MQNRVLKKTAIILSVLLAVVVAASVLLSYLIINNQLKSQLADTNLELLRQVDDKLELMLKSIDKSTIQLLRRQEVIRFFDGGLNDSSPQDTAYRVTSMLDDLVNSDEYIFSIEMYSYIRHRFLSGTVMSKESEGYQDVQWMTQFESYEGFSKWLPTRRIPINSVSYSSYRNVVTLVRTYPLLHSPGARRGAVAVNIKENMLYDLIDDPASSSRMETFIMDQEGNVVLDVDKSRLGRDISETIHIRNILDSGANEGHFAAKVNDVSSSVFYVEASYPGWHIVRIVPAVQLNEPLTAIRNGLIVLAPILLLLAGLLTIAISRWSLKPVQGFIHSLSKHLTAHQRSTGNSRPVDEFVYLEKAVEDIIVNSEQLNRQVHESKPILKWQLLTELLSNYRRNFTNVKPYMDMLGIRLHENQLVVMAAQFDNKAGIVSSNDLHLYAYALCNVAEELINAENLGVAVELENGLCAVIMSFSDPGEHEQQMMRAVSVGDLMKNFAVEYFKRTITIGIGSPVDAINDVHVSYEQAIEALSYRMVLGPNTIITYDELPSERLAPFHRLFAMTDQMIGAIRTGDAAKLKVLIEKWFAAIAAQNVPPDMIKQLAVQGLMKATGELDDLGVDREGLLPEINPYDMMDQYERLDELEGLMTGILMDALERIREKRGRRERHEVIDKMLDYIHQHYMRSDLSLNLLADEFGLSVSHLSKQFKEQKECNFIDYLMELRMEKARQRLSETNDKIMHIAEHVGYTNVNSFVRIFKKSTGMTPTEFREKHHSTA